MNFLGYKREYGSVGTRNYVGIISTVVCANEVAQAIADKVQGTAAFVHNQGCCQTQIDIDRVNEVLIGLANNPNIASVVLVSLGCESTNIELVIEGIKAKGKWVEVVVIHEIGGAARTIAEGCLIAQEMVHKASILKREPCPISDLMLGLKCGSSDTTSGLAPNPALGVTSDLIVNAGGTSILGEVTEFIGAEHLLCKHAKSKELEHKILDYVKKMESRAMSVGCDMRGGQPTGGNIKGGLSTIEEKSLGAIAKAGESKIQEVCEYGVKPTKKGLVVMDSPGREPEILTGLAAAGCNIIAFTTGRGAPQGFPFVPVVKITGNKKTWVKMRDHMDINLQEVMDGTLSIPDAGKQILENIIETASGQKTKAEVSGYTRSMNIYTVGPII